MPETKGRSLEEIEAAFSPGNSWRVDGGRGKIHDSQLRDIEAKASTQHVEREDSINKAEL